MYVHTKTCAWLFIATLFTVAPNCKQPKYSSAGKNINCILSLQWNTTQQWKQITDTWMSINESQKYAKWKKPGTKEYMLHGSIYMNLYSPVTESRWGIARGKGHLGTVWGLKTSLCSLCSWLHGCIHLLKYIKMCTWNEWILFYVNFITIMMIYEKPQIPVLMEHV